jgi:hypothetical protein
MAFSVSAFSIFPDYRVPYSTDFCERPIFIILIAELQKFNV